MNAKRFSPARPWILAATLIVILFLALASAPRSNSAPDAPAATVSGVIRHDGSPVSGVEVRVIWPGGSQQVTTGSNGVYSVSGVPAGNWIQIFVRPLIAQRLAFRNWDTDNLTGDLTKDFDLVDGYRLQGEFHKPDGTLYAQAFWLETKPTTFSPPAGEWLGENALNGQFDLVLPPDLYTLNLESPRPYYMPHVKLDLRGADQTGVIVTLLSEKPPPFPTTPPDASRISVSAATTDGYATVTGSPGAVEPLAAVAIVNLSAANLMTATSDASGAFAATLYAPPGSSLLVKVDPDGGRVAELWRKSPPPDSTITYEQLNPLPGVIMSVGAPQAGTSTNQPFQGVTPMRGKPWASGWISGTLQSPPGASGVGYGLCRPSRDNAPGLTIQRGQVMTITSRLQVHSPAINCAGAPTFTVAVHVMLRYLFAANGRAQPWNIWFTSHLFTPTGLPIEQEGVEEARHFAPVQITQWTCASPHAIETDLNTAITIPNDLPDGIYLPGIAIDSSDVPGAATVPYTVIWYVWDALLTLPPLRVGSPASPHIPWVLLGDYPINGQRGVQAREDAGQFAMPTRVVHPPHLAVVPRQDERTGKPIAYRLEPGSNWLSATDRREPCPPRIPLQLPSGALTIQVRKPDGTTVTLGPATIRQSSVRTPTTPGGSDLAVGTGQIGDLYHLATMSDTFAYRFDQDGLHTIALSGAVNDVYGNSYPISGTYDVMVARVLDLDPAQLPTTPYVQGDAFAPGLHLFPPVPADVAVQLVQMPNSNPAQAITRTVTGCANRFGYYQPPAGTAITLTAPGEFRVDITAVYTAADSTLWAGAMTWGNVVEGPSARIEAHGRRGMDYHGNTIDDMPAWFDVFDLVNHRPDKVGIENYYPYFSGDIHWGNEDRQPGDSIHTIITILDKTPAKSIYNLIRANYPRTQGGIRWPPDDTSLAGVNKRIAIDEAPLLISTYTGETPGMFPDKIDQFAYFYGSSERPDVRVRELISTDNMGTAYWRFNDTYGYQIGEGAWGDLPGDLKWEFGGAVFRIISPTNPINEYAIYSSLWVLLPHGCDAFGCARVTPPFQAATGASINGGPIMTLQGKDIDMLFLPKGVRPGDVLEAGDVIAFSGHVGPPLDSRVSVTITAPSGVRHTRAWHANKIGWLYDPTFDFIANEAGRWTVDVSVIHDRPYVGNGVTPASHNTGTVLGANGQYEFYVVQPNSPRLFIADPQPRWVWPVQAIQGQRGIITWPTGRIEPIYIRGIAPAGATSVRYTIHDKGVVMGQGSVTPDASGAFTVTYDAKALNAVFPFLSLTAHEGQWEGLADEVAINLLAVGGELRGNTVTLIGEEVFAGNDLSHRIFLPVTLKEG